MKAMKAMRKLIEIAMGPTLLWLVACSGPAGTKPVTPAPTSEPPLPASAPAPAEAPPGAPAAAAAYSGLGTESLRPQDIASFAPTALPYQVSRRISQALDLRGAAGGIVSERGDRMFFTWNVTGQSQVWRLDGPGRYPIQLTGGEDLTSVVAVFGGGTTAVVSRDIAGQENPGLYILKGDGGPLRPIQHKEKVQTLFGFVSDDDRSVYYLANDIVADSYALYRWDVATEAATPVFTQPGIWRVLDHQGGTVLLGKALGNTNVEVFELDLATGALSPRFGQGEGQYHDARYGTKGAIIVRTDKASDRYRLYQWQQGGALTPFGPEQAHEISSFSVDRARRRVYAEVNRDGFAELVVLDAKSGRVLPTPGLPPAPNRRIGSITKDGRRAVISLDQGDRPPVSVVYDWTTRKAAVWRTASAPEVDLGTFVPAQVEHYVARDGARIPMLVRRPKRCAATPCPVVVEFHGGPESQARPSFDPSGQLFVDAGFVLIEPNVRGSSGYGKEWLHADNGKKRLDVVTDIEDAAIHVRKAFAADGVEPKVGVYGGSYGGYSTLMAMTKFAGAYDAGVSVVGISNLVTFLENTAPYRRILRTSEYGDPAVDRDALVALSPTTHIAKLAAPLLIIQGVNDPRVPAGEAMQMYRALEARKIPGKLILFADEGHGMTKRANRVLGLGHALAFFETHLLAR